MVSRSRHFVSISYLVFKHFTAIFCISLTCHYRLKQLPMFNQLSHRRSRHQVHQNIEFIDKCFIYTLWWLFNYLHLEFEWNWNLNCVESVKLIVLLTNTMFCVWLLVRCHLQCFSSRNVYSKSPMLNYCDGHLVAHFKVCPSCMNFTPDKSTHLDKGLPNAVSVNSHDY
jgi:hypothetical protein